MATMNEPLDIIGVILAAIILIPAIPLIIVAAWLLAMIVGILHIVAWVCAIVRERARDAAGTASGL